jgi:hypothetical protein
MSGDVPEPGAFELITQLQKRVRIAGDGVGQHLNAAGIGGDTRSGFGTKSSTTACPPGFSAPAIFFRSVVHVSAS